MKHIDIEYPKNKETRFVELILKWGKKNKRSFPWRRSRTPYKMLLAEILLQRTPANRVADFFPELVEKFPSPQSLARSDITDLEEFLHPMGLKKRAKWLISLMKEVCEKYDCTIPDKEKELIKFPGVGLYTARAILCFGFGKGVSIVDVNVARVLLRVFGVLERKRRPTEDVELWSFATSLLPKKQAVSYNEALLDFAILVCKKRPLCNTCPLSHVCDYFSSTSTLASPNPALSLPSPSKSLLSLMRIAFRSKTSMKRLCTLKTLL